MIKVITKTNIKSFCNKTKTVELTQPLCCIIFCPSSIKLIMVNCTTSSTCSTPLFFTSKYNRWRTDVICKTNNNVTMTLQSSTSRRVRKMRQFALNKNINCQRYGLLNQTCLLLTYEDINTKNLSPTQTSKLVLRFCKTCYHFVIFLISVAYITQYKFSTKQACLSGKHKVSFFYQFYSQKNRKYKKESL